MGEPWGKGRCKTRRKENGGSARGGKSDHPDEREEGEDAGEADEVLAQAGREDEDVTCVFDQRGKAGNAEGHKKEPEDLPAIEFCFASARTGGAQKEGKTDDGAQAHGGHPKARIRIEFVPNSDHIPNGVAPENCAPRV